MSDTGEMVNLLDYTGRSGVDLGKGLRGYLGKDIESIIPGSVPKRATADTGYIDYADAWTEGGGGAATKQMLDQLEANPKIFESMDKSPALRDKALMNLDRDAAFAKKHGLPIRKDIQNARKILYNGGKSGGVTKLKAALQKGTVALPALVDITIIESANWKLQ